MSSDLKVTNIKHASSGSNNLVLGSDGSATINQISSSTVFPTGVLIQSAFKSYTNTTTLLTSTNETQLASDPFNAGTNGLKITKRGSGTSTFFVEANLGPCRSGGTGWYAGLLRIYYSTSSDPSTGTWTLCALNSIGGDHTAQKGVDTSKCEGFFTTSETSEIYFKLTSQGQTSTYDVYTNASILDGLSAETYTSGNTGFFRVSEFAG